MASKFIILLLDNTKLRLFTNWRQTLNLLTFVALSFSQFVSSPILKKRRNTEGNSFHKIQTLEFKQIFKSSLMVSAKRNSISH